MSDDQTPERLVRFYSGDGWKPLGHAFADLLVVDDPPPPRLHFTLDDSAHGGALGFLKSEMPRNGLIVVTEGDPGVWFVSTIETETHRGAKTATLHCIPVDEHIRTRVVSGEYFLANIRRDRVEKLARRARQVYWCRLAEVDRADAEPSPDSLAAWCSVVNELERPHGA